MNSGQVFRIEFTAAAERQLHRLDRAIQVRLRNSIDTLVQLPIPPGAKKMKAAGVDTLWRIRVGDYRVVYKIEGHRLVVLIVKVGHRREVYR